MALNRAASFGPSIPFRETLIFEEPFKGGSKHSDRSTVGTDAVAASRLVQVNALRRSREMTLLCSPK